MVISMASFITHCTTILTECHREWNINPARRFIQADWVRARLREKEKQRQTDTNKKMVMRDNGSRRRLVQRLRSGQGEEAGLMICIDPDYWDEVQLGWLCSNTPVTTHTQMSWQISCWELKEAMFFKVSFISILLYIKTVYFLENLLKHSYSCLIR